MSKGETPDVPQAVPVTVEPANLRDVIRDILASYIRSPLLRTQIETTLWESFDQLFCGCDTTDSLIERSLGTPEAKEAERVMARAAAIGRAAETVTITRATLAAGIIVGIIGEDDECVTQRQVDRAVDLIFRNAAYHRAATPSVGLDGREANE